MSPSGSPRARWSLTFDEHTRHLEVGGGLSLPEEFRYSVSPPDGAVTATVHIRMVDGVAVCTRATVDRTDGQPLRARDIQGVQFGQLIADAPQVAALAESSGPIDVDNLRARDVDEDELANLGRKVARRRGISVDLRVVAEKYREACRQGEAAPVRVVAEHFNVGHRTAQRRIEDARDAGYLKPALSRRAGEALALSGKVTAKSTVTGSLTVDHAN